MKNETERYTLFYITAPIGEPARLIAQELVNKKLAACVNILPSVESYFHWEGKVDHEQESLLIGKTEKRFAEIILKVVPEIHPYKVCEIIFVPIEQGYTPYLNWITSALKETDL
ncbi:MAG: divalent-cation tolerance protein CutA [Candidatus Auribacterota bacterium]|jgi:periplasmic divalent cation tolerance protein|nr:divalent-cation tolerance protein CutA [Candidatus Auribacterota bacterium]